MIKSQTEEPELQLEWRQMEKADLSSVKILADAIHTSYPEDAAVFDERLRLYSAGCRVMILGNAIAGYCIAHPWRFGQPPVLNSQLGALPRQPDTLYLHDLALATHVRGRNAARPHITTLIKQAREARLPNLSLTAISGSMGFWQKNGFVPLRDAERTGGLASYGAEACFMVHPIMTE